MGNLDRAVLFRQINRLYRDGTCTAQSDAQLLDRYLSYRDERAFEAIVELHGPMVLSLCRRFLRDPHDVEDAFQATFLILARKAGSIRKRDVLASWLYGVAYRIAVRSRTEVLKRRSLETAVPLLDDPADFRVHEVDEFGPVLDQELNRLPEKYRAPIVLCYLREQTHDQAAAALRWPVGTVRSRLARGRELLKERLTRRGCTPASATLGMTPGLSLRSVTAPLPRSLVEVTVAAAGHLVPGGSAGTGAAGLSLLSSSGSVVTLAQGVLTTMALTQIKLIGAGLAAAGVLVGGVGAGAWALGSGGRDDRPDTPATVQKAPPRSATTPSALPTPSADVADLPVAKTPPPNPPGAPAQDPNVEARLADLERKLDMLLRLMQQSRSSRLDAPRTSGRVRSSQLPRNEPPVSLDQLPPQPSSMPRVTQLPEAPADLLPAGAPSARPAPPGPPPTRPDSDPELTPTPPPAPPEAEPTRFPRPAAINPPADATPTRLPEPTVSPVPRASTPPLEPDYEPASATRPARARADLIDRVPSQRSTAREIEAELQIAIRRHQRIAALFKQGVIGQEQYESTTDQIRLLDGRIRGMEEELADEAERLKVELMRKKAEIGVTEAQLEQAATKLAQSRHLQEKKMISNEEASKYESDSRAAAAQVEAKRADLLEVELRLKQIEKRRSALEALLGLAAKAIAALNLTGQPLGSQ
jgi:RNA polymerase sigma factor (sigma-70 family)